MEFEIEKKGVSKGKKEKYTMKGMKEAHNWLQHHFNSLHIYCRLVKVMPERLAKKIALYWETTAIYRYIYSSI